MPAGSDALDGDILDPLDRLHARARVTPDCAACGRRLIGEHAYIAETGDLYCQSCEEDTCAP